MDFLDFDATTWVIIALSLLVLGSGGFFYVRARKGKDEPIHYLRCPSCKRKLKYLAHQIGHKGMYANCKEKFVFPSPHATTHLKSI